MWLLSKVLYTPIVAKEGVTVVKSIGFKDQVKNILSATNDVASEGMLICSEKILVYIV
jgi:hypothetical protein